MHPQHGERRVTPFSSGPGGSAPRNPLSDEAEPSIAVKSEYEPMPPCYEKWLRGLIGAMPAREIRATCSDCAMCAAKGATVRPFNPEAKCCTYVPILSNFLVGAILRDHNGTPEGQASVRARIAARSNVTPLGLGQPAIFGLAYEAAGEAGFGMAAMFRCPHYIEDNGGSCGIWRHRNAVCSTWFCKHVRGSVGRRMWRDIEVLLKQIEADLASWACARLGTSPDQDRSLLASRAGRSSALLSAEVAGRWNVDYARMWGTWAGKEEEFFKACGDLIAPLEWRDVQEILGEDALRAVAVARHSVSANSKREMPKRLQLGRFSVHPDRERALLLTDSPFDPISIPWPALGRLGELSGGVTLAEAIEAGVSLADLGELLDWGVVEQG